MNSQLSALSFFQLWFRTSVRHWRQHRLQFFTLVGILALGVASFLSIRMANRAAIQGFRGFTESITGNTDLTLNPQGDRFLVDWLPEIRNSLREFPVEITPVLEISGRILEDSESSYELGTVITLIGVDVVGIGNVHNGGNGGLLLNTESIQAEFDLFDIIQEPRSLFISPGLSEKLQVATGDELTLLIKDKAVTLNVRAVLPANRLGVEMPANMVLMDLPAAMMLTGDIDSVTRVEFILETDASRENTVSVIQNRLMDIADGRWTVTTPQGQVESNATMTAAFRLNLTILSLISLLVGVFLITQSMDAAVIQRRTEIGILRALGVLPSQIRKLWLLDLLAFGFLGSLLGILLGWLAAQSVVVAIARTVNALYLASTASSAQLTLSDCLFGFVLGFVGSLLAGLFPLNVANKLEPSKILASGRQEISRSRFHFQIWGWSLIVSGFLFTRLPPLEFTPNHSLPVFGYLTAFVWLMGGALVVAGWIARVGNGFRSLFSFSISGNVGFGKLRLPGNRHRLAVAGLFVAIGMAASMSILIGSFEATVLAWLNNRFQADLYVSNKAFNGGSSTHYVSENTLNSLTKNEAISDISTVRYLNIQYQERPVFLIGFRTSLLGERESFLWIKEPLPLRELPPKTDGWAIANEAFQYRFGHQQGEVLTIDSPAGEKRIWLRAIKADYGSDRGSLSIDETLVKAWFGTRDYSNLSLYLESDVNAERIAEQLEKQYPGLAIRPQETLLQNAIRIFRETFAVTYALRVLGLFVAVVGLALALMNILREDASSLATLNGLGVRRRERATITACEGLGLSIVAVIGGLVLSLGLGWLLVYVINRQSFGWTLQYSIPWGSVLGMSILLLVLGFTVSWLVGWFNGNTKPTQEE